MCSELRSPAYTLIFIYYYQVFPFLQCLIYAGWTFQHFQNKKFGKNYICDVMKWFKIRTKELRRQLLTISFRSLCCNINISKHEMWLVYSPRSPLQVFSGSHIWLEAVAGTKTKSRKSDRGTKYGHPCLYILRRRRFALIVKKELSATTRSSCHVRKLISFLPIKLHQFSGYV